MGSNRVFAFFTATLLFLLPYTAQATKFYKDFFPSPEAYCVEGCNTVAQYLTFNYTSTLDPEEDYYKIQCSNSLLVQSIYLCAQVHCSTDEIAAGIAVLNRDCEDYGDVTLPSFETYALSPEELAQVPRVNDTAGSTSAVDPLNHPVVPDAEWWAQGTRTLVRSKTSRRSYSC